MKKLMMKAALAVIGAAVTGAPALALDAEHRMKADAMAAKAIAFLRSQQDEKTGGWSVNPQGPNFPAITGLVVTGMLKDPAIDCSDPAVARGVQFMLSYKQPDGGIYDRVLASYNTSICVSALAQCGTEAARGAVRTAIPFLRSLQWSEDSNDMEGETGTVGPDHPFYGGVGYGRHGRPDNSNLQLFTQALHDAGVSPQDPAFQRALVFLKRTQMDDRINDMPYAEGSRQGGFVYATASNAQTAGEGQSQAGEVEETLSDGTVASRLRAYGSMTYAGFKTLIYADLDRDDPRVQAAYDWIRRNYTVRENPGMGTDGLYYYFLTMARALQAWGSPQIDTLNSAGQPYEERDWQNDLVARLQTLQLEDGSFQSVDDRWMEDNTVLITAYALIALQEVRGEE